MNTDQFRVETLRISTFYALSVHFHFWISFTALKIHVSQGTADILIKDGSFELEERGEIEIKVSLHDIFPHEMYHQYLPVCLYLR